MPWIHSAGWQQTQLSFLLSSLSLFIFFFWKFFVERFFNNFFFSCHRFVCLFVWFFGFVLSVFRKLHGRLSDRWNSNLDDLGTRTQGNGIMIESNKYNRDKYRLLTILGSETIKKKCQKQVNPSLNPTKTKQKILFIIIIIQRNSWINKESHQSKARGFSSASSFFLFFFLLLLLLLLLFLLPFFFSSDLFLLVVVVCIV